MIIKYPKKKNSTIIIITLFLSLIFLPLLFNKKYFEIWAHNIITKVMTYDLGVSSFSDLVGTEWRNYKRLPLTIFPSVFHVFKKKIDGLSERPFIDSLEITIKFKDYKKILEDRKIAWKNDILTNPKEVKAKIKFNGKIYKGKIRLKGDLKDHWGGMYRMSFRVKLKGNDTILGFKRFSIQKPRARQHPYDQTFQALRQVAGGLSPSQKYARIIINGTDWGIMNIEEHMSKELLEKQKRKESIIIKFGNEKNWFYERSVEKKYLYPEYRIGSDRLNIFLYNSSKYFKSPLYRKWFSYIAQKRLQQNEISLYDINEFGKAYVLSTIFGSKHAILNRNSRFYFNPYTLVLEPITTDQSIPDSKFLETSNPNDPYDKIIESDLFKQNIESYVIQLNEAVSKSQEVMDYYQKFFPADKKINTIFIKNNFDLFIKNPSKYLFNQNRDQKYKDNNKITILPTKEQSNYFFDHIYARHFTNGEIHIYNLLPDTIKIKAIHYNNNEMTQNVSLAGFKKNNYVPIILKTNILGIADKKIMIETEYQGNQREYAIDYSLIPGPYLNPITDISTSNQEFLEKIANDEWLIKKGNWEISKPIVLTGKVTIEPGTHLMLTENSYIIIKGQLIALGNNKEKIILEAKNFWKGLYVIGDKKSETFLQNVVIKNTIALEDGLLKLTGGVNFYNCKIQIKNTLISGTKAEDALNIVNSNFLLNNVYIEKTFSDGFDSDFSIGTITNSKFINIGGDALDFSGNNVEVTNSLFENIRDKAISVGESTKADLENLKINIVGTGIASKDGSNVNAKNISINNYKLHAAMTYIKKKNYGSPEFVGTNITTNPDTADTFLAQTNTSMSINGRLVNTSFLDVKNLYQSETMKK